MKAFSEVKEREKMQEDEIREWQTDQLMRVITHAVQHVPYYRRLFQEYGLGESDIQNVDDLVMLPYLEKDTIRKRLSEFLPTNYKKKLLIRGSTSGSTGTPLWLYRTLDSIIKEHAYVWRQFSWAGCKLGERIVALRGDLVVPSSQRNPPFWRYDVPGATLVMSSYHISQSTIPAYLATLRHYNPALIYAYPSAIYLLSKYIVSNDIEYRLPSLRGIVTSSETLFPAQRETIERGMGCKVFDWYGLAERVSFIGTCEWGSYHIFDDYGFTEFIPVGNDRYELVGTGFSNFGMPLIRYRTGDVVQMTDHKQCGCGRSFRMVHAVEGRLDDMLKLKSGRLIGRVDHIFKGLENIIEAQVLQQTMESILIRLVVDKCFSENTLRKLVSNAKERFGDEVDVQAEIVSEIRRTRTGKFKGVVSLVN